MLNVYISCASSEAERADTCASLLCSTGAIIVPCRWWEGAEAWTGKDDLRSHSDRIRITRELFDAIEQADALLFLAPTPGHSSRMSWCEWGYANALERGITIVAAGDYSQSVCTALADKAYGSDGAAIDYLIGMALDRVVPA